MDKKRLIQCAREYVKGIGSYEEKIAQRKKEDAEYLRKQLHRPIANVFYDPVAKKIVRVESWYPARI